MLTCRRSRRSSVTSLALEFLLDAEVERSGARAVSVSTLDGMLLAGVGELSPDMVALAGAAKLAGLADHPVLSGFEGTPFGLSVVELPQGERLLLTSVGAPQVSRTVEAGALRILS